MSTRIGTISPEGSHAVVYRFDPGRLSVDGRIDFGITYDGQREVGVGMARDAFIAAIEAELGVKVVPADAIVVERGDLPVVRVSKSAPDYAFIEGMDKETWIGNASSDEVRAIALRNLALAEYLSAHPPVDEARVSELLHVIQTHVSANVTRTGALSILRDLEAQGWTKPGVES